MVLYVPPAPCTQKHSSRSSKFEVVVGDERQNLHLPITYATYLNSRTPPTVQAMSRSRKKESMASSSSQASSLDGAAESKEQQINDAGKSAAAGEEKMDAANDSITTTKTTTGFKWNPQKKKGRKKSGKGMKEESVGNELSHLIPGYTAPMRLEAKSLKGITGQSLSEIRKRDTTTYATPAVSILDKNTNTTSFDPKKVKTPSSIAIQKAKGTSAARIPTSFSSSFQNKSKKQNDNTAGSGWFNMNPHAMTDSLKTDLAIIRNRNYLDPKKFYKSSDSFEGKVLQVGTVIEGSAEFYSSRLAKRDRRQNLTEEVMADSNVSNYAKRKFYEVQAERASKRSNYNKGGGGKRGRKTP